MANMQTASRTVTIQATESTSGEFTPSGATGLSYSLRFPSGAWATARLVVQGYNAAFDRWEILAYDNAGTVTLLELPIDTAGRNIQASERFWQIGTYPKLRFASINAASDAAVAQTNPVEITVRLQTG